MAYNLILCAFIVSFVVASLPWQCQGIFCAPKFMKALPNSPLSVLTTSVPARPMQRNEGQSKDAPVKRIGEDFIAKWKSRIRNNGAHLLRGSKGLGLQLKKAAELKLHQVQNGKHSISYEEFHYIEQASADFGKAFRKLSWAPFGKRYVFLSTFVFPLFSSNHLATFTDFPTSFLSTNDQKAREDILTKRRMQAAMHGLYFLQEGQVLDDVARNDANAQQAKIVENALQQRNLSQALQALDPLLVKRDMQKTSAVGVAALPGALVKQCLQALGAASVPNFPILRALNTLSLKNRVNGIQRSDDFIAVKGVSTLTIEEVKLACFERCIQIEGRVDSELRHDLSEWLQLVRPSVHHPAHLQTHKTNENSGSLNMNADLAVSTDSVNATLVLPTLSAHTIVVSDATGEQNISTPITTSAVSISTPLPTSRSDLSDSIVSRNKTLLTSVREALDKSIRSMKDLRDATKKAAEVATNAQNKRFAMLTLHALKSLKNSSFGGVYRAALTDPPCDRANATVPPK